MLKSRRSRVWNRSQSERMESATCCGMESRVSEYGIKPQGEAYTRLRVMPYAQGRFHAMRKRIDSMPSLRLV